ncbi:MAG: Ig-like domain-containing protein [Candidatus Acidiferrales bacterium]
MKTAPVLLLSLLVGIVGCSGGTKSSSPSSNPSVTSVAVSPASVSVPTGQTKQFTATVSGSTGVSQAVTWSVVGAGTINSSGLFTASSSAGSATVMAVSQQDTSVSGTAAVTVSQATVNAGNWYGSLTSSDGTQLYATLDFTILQQGSALVAQTAFDVYATTSPSFVSNNCQVAEPLSSAFFLNSVMSGTMSGQNVSLTYTPPDANNPNSTQDIVLTGTRTGSTMSGTFVSPNGATCLPSQTGNFSFQQYTLQQVNYTGDFTIASATGPIAVPFTLSITFPVNATGSLNGQGITIGGCPDYPARSFGMNGQQWGRLFVFTSESVLPSNSPGLQFDGLLNDTAGQTATVFSFGATPVNAFPNCLANENVTSNQMTLTATP